MNLSAELIELIPEKAFFMNLRKTRSSEGWAKSISSRPGIYAWFRTFSYETLDTEAFKKQLFDDIYSKKYAERSGKLEPLHRVTLTSEPSLKKKGKIEDALERPNFRESLAEALSFSILLQAPLYVGKAGDLRQRLLKHFNGQTQLKERFSAAGVAIEGCSLLYIYTGPEIHDSTSTLGSGQDTPTESIEDIDDIEDLYEEIFSRLFSPLFTLRYG